MPSKSLIYPEELSFLSQTIRLSYMYLSSLQLRSDLPKEGIQIQYQYILRRSSIRHLTEKQNS